MGELEVFFFTYIRKNAMQSQDNGLQESVFAEHSHAFLHIVQWSGNRKSSGIEYAHYL